MFSNTPRDILALILDGTASSFLIINLWKCGNRDLNAKLAKCITHVDLMGDSGWPCRFPLMLGELTSLRHLSICHRIPIVRSPKDWQFIMRKLPEALESLSIRTPQAIASILNYAPEWTASDPITVDTRYTRGYSKVIDLDRLFPNLHTLELELDDGIDIYDLSDFAACLPSKLHTLRIPHLKITKNEASFIAMLPRSLEVLDTFISIYPENPSIQFGDQLFRDLALAPPKLHTVRTISVADADVVLPHLPKSLTHGLLKCSHWTPSLHKDMPPNIQELSLSIFSEMSAPFTLPTHLTELHLSNDIELNLGQHLSLPPSLTSLSFFYEPWKDMIAEIKERLLQGRSDATALWPPQLSTLRCIAVDVETGAILLPSSLKSLHLTLNCVSTTKTRALEALELINPSACATASSRDLSSLPLQLPPHLTDLVLQLIECDRISNILPINLPSSLTDILTRVVVSSTDMTSDSRIDWPFDPHSNAESLTKMSRLAIHLPVLPRLSSSTLGQYILPQNLTTIHSIPWHCDWFSYLPRSLTSLYLHTLSGVPQVATEDIFLSLPPHLAELAIGRTLSANETDTSPQLLSATSFSSLLHLTNLSVYDSCVFPSKILRHLPKSLRSLRLELQSIERDDAPFISPSLHMFDAGDQVDYKQPYLVDYWPLRSVGLAPPHLQQLLLKRLPI